MRVEFQCKTVERVLFYLGQPGHGGAERVATTLANHLVQNGYFVIVAVNFDAETKFDIDSRVQFEILDEGETSSNFFERNRKRIAKLRGLIKENRIDTAVSFLLEQNVRLIKAAKGLDVRTCISVRSNPNVYIGSNIFRKAAVRALYSKASGCVFQTEGQKSFYPKSVQNKSIIIENPVENAFFDKGWQGDGNYIVTVGRLVSAKNFPLFIDAFSRIAEENKEIHLRIYGGGELKEQLEAQIRKLALQNRIKLMGDSSEIPEILSHAKMFILSSDHEGMPNALMEAVTMGIPCVSTDCAGGGARQIFSGTSGVLVPVGDADVMADAILKLLYDKERQEKMHTEFKKRAEDFRIERIIAQWLNYLEKLE